MAHSHSQTCLGLKPESCLLHQAHLKTISAMHEEFNFTSLFNSQCLVANHLKMHVFFLTFQTNVPLYGSFFTPRYAVVNLLVFSVNNFFLCCNHIKCWQQPTLCTLCRFKGNVWQKCFFIKQFWLETKYNNILFSSEACKVWAGRCGKNESILPKTL